ncbi:MAG: DUF1579 domain-containing protein [Euryarchaeota archaeon]|nr:DUF1579 domain-containing protein [Euryarchaeota archaeon]
MVDAEHNINRLAGEWHVRMNFTMEDGSTAKGTGTATVRSIALGRGVGLILEGDVEGIGSYEEHSTMAYDSESDQVCMFVVTSLGIVHSHFGRFDGDNCLTLRWQGTLGGKAAEEEITLSFLSEDEFAIQQVDRIEGNVATTGEYAFQRKGRKVLEGPVPSFA